MEEIGVCMVLRRMYDEEGHLNGNAEIWLTDFGIY